jgi:Protein of unknown function (DUF3667)
MSADQPENETVSERDQKRQALIGSPCLNCGKTLAGEYCHHCGQPAADLKQTLRGLMRDYGSSAFSLDAQLWKTLRCLLLQPGQLAVEYLEGRRSRYIAPLRLYLTWSFILFLILSIVPAANLGMEFNFTDDDGQDISNELTVAERDSLFNAIDIGGILSSTGVADSSQAAGALAMEDGELIVGGETSSDISRGVMEHMPKAMFFLVPFSALLIKLAYIRRRRPYLNHLICALGLHTFSFMVLSLAQLALLIPSASKSNISQAMMLAVVVYAALAFRRIYGGSWKKTIAKVLAISLMYLVSFGLALTGIYFLSYHVFR